MDPSSTTDRGAVSAISAQLDELTTTLHTFRALVPDVASAGETLRLALERGGAILTAGNGGSAADASHLAEELVGRFDKERGPLRAVSLCADATLLTCVANDYGYEQIFARQVEGIGRPGDVLVAFSTSGASPNIVLALKVARARGLKTVALLGKTGGSARGLADHEVLVPSNVTARIQEVHAFVFHVWLSLIEASI
jgi:D-sedoheptulose 7-phosphate isomerase